MASPGPFPLSLFSAFDKLRASGPPTQLLAPLAALIILRWADQLETDQEAIAAFDGTSFSSTLAPAARWRDFCDLDGPALSRALAEQVAPGIKQCREVGSGALVRRIEHTVSTLTSLDAGVLGPLVEVVRALPLVTPADREQVLDAFDAVLTLSDDPHRSGMWGATTPRAVVDLVLELASPQPGERVYDPCFGAASMLAACARRIRARLKTSPPKAWLDAQRGAFFGVELQPEVFTIGLARMILAGVIARHTSPSAWASAVGPSGTTSMPTPPGRPRGDRLGRPAAAGK